MFKSDKNVKAIFINETRILKVDLYVILYN